MSFKHLVDSPRRYPGGVLFTVDQHAVQRTVWVTDRAIARIDRRGRDDRGILHIVMANLRELVELAMAKVSSKAMPELVVVDEDAIVGLAIAR